MKEASLLYPEMDIISLGDDNNPMSFEDENGNPTEVEVEVEIPRGRYYAGNKQKLLYSEDNGVTWKEFGTAPIIDL